MVTLKRLIQSSADATTNALINGFRYILTTIVFVVVINHVDLCYFRVVCIYAKAKKLGCNVSSLNCYVLNGCTGAEITRKCAPRFHLALVAMVATLIKKMPSKKSNNSVAMTKLAKLLHPTSSSMIIHARIRISS